jgi:deoxyribonuclease V
MNARPPTVVSMPAPSPSWPATASEAIALQKELAPRVETIDRLGEVRIIAGIDVAFPGGGEVTRAAIVAMSYPGLEVVETRVAEEPTRFPYIPGLLSFREAPAVLAALAGLTAPPDLMMIDGHGIAHPRRLGIACHVGLLTGLPAIGVAKSRLCGRHDEPGPEKGARTPLSDGAEVLGAVLRTRSRVKPVYVSAGHRIGLETAVALVLTCASRFRLPEPTRLADKLSKGLV